MVTTYRFLLYALVVEDNFNSGYLTSKLNLLLLSGIANALVLIYVSLEKSESH